MWQRSSNLETLGGRERSPRGLYVSERESEGDHRPIAAQWQEPPRGDKDTCDFNSLLLSAREGTRRARLHPYCARNIVEQRIRGSLLHILTSEHDTCGYARRYMDTHIKNTRISLVSGNGPRAWCLKGPFCRFYLIYHKLNTLYVTFGDRLMLFYTWQHIQAPCQSYLRLL